MAKKSKVVQDSSSYLESKIRDDLLSEIPADLVAKAKSTGKGYIFKLVQDRSRKTDRVRRVLTASKFFVKKGDVLYFKRDPKIQATVVNDGQVEVSRKGGKPWVLTFATAAKWCDMEVRGADAANRSPVAWQTMFMKEDPKHGMETLTQRRDRIVDEQLNKIKV